jgi:hypothetical protein
MLVAELTEMYKSHIGTEEREVFPAAARLLDPTQRAEVGAEMAERRGLRLRPKVTKVTES